MKRSMFLAIVAVLLAGGIVGTIVSLRKTPTQPKSAQSQTKRTQPGKTALDPLAINAIRSRGYTASPIVTGRDLGDQGGYRQSVVHYTSDNLTVNALESIPNSLPPAGGFPVVILMHGYIPPSSYQTAGGDYHDFIASWAQAGFVVLKPDYRGNGSSGGTASSGHYSPDYAYDMLNLIASLKHYNLVNPNRIGIFGHSMGGHIALRTAVSSQSVKATVIANGVVGSMHDLFYNWPHSPAPHDQPGPVVTAQLQELVTKHGNPKTNPSFYAQASAINYVGNIVGPVQIDHDVADTTVPFAFAQNLDNALRAANKSVSFYAYSGDDHQFAIPSNHQLILERTTQFFQKNL